MTSAWDSSCPYAEGLLWSKKVSLAGGNPLGVGMQLLLSLGFGYSVVMGHGLRIPTVFSS